MSDVVIKVEGLSKAYRLGTMDSQPDTLVEALYKTATAPLRNYRRLKRLDTFTTGDDADDILWALKDVSFEINEGEVVGFVGRNGAGKSTLLKILSRITEPTAGRIEIHGRVSSLLEVGTGFHAELTGRENVYMNGTILGMKRAEIDAKFDEIVDFSGVERFLDTPVKRYSSGMKVRLAFAVAAHLEPEILIIDEVLAVGDADFQKKCLGKMREVAGGGRTVLFVSHNMAALQELCGRALCLNQGQCIDDGEAREVVKGYLNRLTDLTSERFNPKGSGRIGSGEARLVAAEIEGVEGNRSGVIFAGEPMKMLLTYKCFRELRNARVVVTVVDDFARPLATLSNDLYDYSIDFNPEMSVVCVSIDACPFAVGSYRVIANIYKDNALVDAMNSAAVFEVAGSVFFCGARAPDQKWSPIYLKHNWAVSQDSI